MLRVEPLARVAAIKREVSFLAKSPQNISRSSAICVINLDDPALVSHREKEIPVISAVNQGI